MLRFNGCQNGYGWLVAVLLSGLVVLSLYSGPILIVQRLNSNLIDTTGQPLTADFAIGAQGAPDGFASVPTLALTRTGADESPLTQSPPGLVGSTIRSHTHSTNELANRSIRSIRSPNPVTARLPGLAAPARLTYEYGVTLSGPPDPNVWHFFTDPSVTVSYAGEGLRIERGAQYEADWAPEVVLHAKPRLNFSGVPGTVVEWQLTIGAQQAEAVVYLKLTDEDADRYFELACGEHEVAGQWDCDLFLRRLSDHAHLWHGGKVSALRGQPAFGVGEWHRLALVYGGGQNITLRVDETFEQSFALADAL